MPFNDYQQEMYCLSLDFITEKLDTIVKKSIHHQSALNAACFLLHVTLNYSDREKIEKISLLLYKEQKYQIIRKIFLEIHDLLNQKRIDHSFIKSVTDPRFFSTKEKQSSYVLRLQETFSAKLKKDLAIWLKQKYDNNLVSRQDIISLENIYSRSPTSILYKG